MKKRFYLVRHGEKIKQIGDPQLSEKGLLQARLTGNYFKDIPVDKIISSPILRTKQTAQQIASILSLDFIVHDLLKERVNWGDDPRQNFEDFVAMWEKASKDRTWQPPVGDSSKDSGKRMEHIITSLLPTNFEHVILVTHGGIICDYLRNTFQREVLEQFSDDDLIFDDAISECSITTIEYNENEKDFKLLEMASVSHLTNI